MKTGRKAPEPLRGFGVFTFRGHEVPVDYELTAPKKVASLDYRAGRIQGKLEAARLISLNSGQAPAL
jgi:hypothetical protein